jgi:DNA replication protein DnaC
VKRLSQVRVLILDDFGLRNYTHDEANVLVDILEDRHKKGSVIVTSQADPKGWPKLFEDPLIAEAMYIVEPTRQGWFKSLYSFGV